MVLNYKLDCLVALQGNSFINDLLCTRHWRYEDKNETVPVLKELMVYLNVLSYLNPQSEFFKYDDVNNDVVID